MRVLSIICLVSITLSCGRKKETPPAQMTQVERSITESEKKQDYQEIKRDLASLEAEHPEDFLTAQVYQQNYRMVKDDEVYVVFKNAANAAYFDVTQFTLKFMDRNNGLLSVYPVSQLITVAPGKEFKKKLMVDAPKGTAKATVTIDKMKFANRQQAPGTSEGLIIQKK